MGILPACQQTSEDAIDAQVELPPERSSDLLPELYTELRELAASRLARENDCITLQATDLVHEAYLRIAGRHEESRWNSKGHFFGAASLAMRRILIERARRRISRGIHAQQRPCELFQLGLLAGEDTTDCDPLDLLTLNDALEQLEASNPGVRNWSNSDFLQACRIGSPPKYWASPRRQLTRTGGTPKHGCGSPSTRVCQYLPGSRATARVVSHTAGSPSRGDTISMALGNIFVSG